MWMFARQPLSWFKIHPGYISIRCVRVVEFARINSYLLVSSLLCSEPPWLSSERSWRTDTTSTVNWSISSRSTSARDTPTPASGNGWWTSTETLTAPTWDILTCSTTSPWLRTRAKRASASTWWRRCFSHVDRLQTNPMMPKPHWSEPWILFFQDVFVEFLCRDIQLDFPPNV